jgi:hypothetical protein
MATMVARSLSPWPLGWIAATSSDQIYLFFSPEVGGGVWVVSHLFGWLIS